MRRWGMGADVRRSSVAQAETERPADPARHHKSAPIRRPLAPPWALVRAPAPSPSSSPMAMINPLLDEGFFPKLMQIPFGSEGGVRVTVVTRCGTRARRRCRDNREEQSRNRGGDDGGGDEDGNVEPATGAMVTVVVVRMTMMEVDGDDGGGDDDDDGG
ncbi:unnamed protein product [Lampetra planeri]